MTYHSLVRPIALYGAETWALLPSMEKIVDVAEMRWVRRLSGITLDRELPNDEVHRRARVPVSLSEACRQARLRYYGHVSRLPADRAPAIALFKDGPCHRRQGRPTTTWLDLIEQDAATRGLTHSDLDLLAKDRDHYRQTVIYACCRGLECD